MLRAMNRLPLERRARILGMLPEGNSLRAASRAFVYAKAKNLPEKYKGAVGYGDIWTWTALDADTKLVPSWAVGRRAGFMARAFISDLADRLATRVQLTTDVHEVYLEAVEGAFGNAIDYAMLI